MGRRQTGSQKVVEVVEGQLASTTAAVTTAATAATATAATATAAAATAAGAGPTPPRWDVFLSHAQASGADQRLHICAELEKRELKVWYDQCSRENGVDVTALGMRQGVRASAVFLAFLSQGYFSRHHCRVELQEALEAGKKVILVHETHPSHGRFDFAAALDGVPAEWHARVKELLSDHNSEEYQRKAQYAKVLFDNLESMIRAESGTRDALGFARTVSSGNLRMARRLAEELAPGTREWIFKRVEAWGREKRTRIFVLTGAAGVGKSVFAGELCRRGGLLDAGREERPTSKGRKSLRQRLALLRLSRRAGGLRVGACHFFMHDDASTADLTTMLLSVAGQLAATVPGLAEKMRAVEGVDELESPTAVLRALIGGPCEELGAPRGGHRYLVVLDALDECPDGPQQQLLLLLKTKWASLVPEWLNLVLTMRPEVYLARQRQRQLDCTELHTEDERNEADLLSYWRQRLPGVVVERDVEAASMLLAKRSGGLFLYARFLDEELRGRRGMTLRDVDEDLDTFPDGLDGYYEMYLRRLRDDALGGDQASYRMLLGAMCAARAPLPDAAVQHLFGLRYAKDVKRLLIKVQNLLHVADCALRFVHKSMPDWLLSEDNLHDLALNVEDLPEAHERLAAWCLLRKGHDFALHNAVFHLDRAGMGAEACELLLDFEWLLEVSRAAAAPQLVADAWGIPIGGDQDAVLAIRAVEKSLHAIGRDPNELPASSSAGYRPSTRLCHKRAPSEASPGSAPRRPRSRTLGGSSSDFSLSGSLLRSLDLEVDFDFGRSIRGAESVSLFLSHALRAVGRLPCLVKLGLTGLTLSRGVRDSLCAGLVGAVALETLRLDRMRSSASRASRRSSGCNASPRDVDEALAGIIVSCSALPRLASLSITGTWQADRHCDSALEGVLRSEGSMRSLRSLDLNGSSTLIDYHMERILLALSATHRRLSELNFAGGTDSRFSSLGILARLLSAGDLPDLRILRFDCCGAIGLHGEPFFRALVGNETLHELSLERCPFGSSVAQLIRNVLLHPRTALRRLHIGAVWYPVVSALESTENRSLLSLSLVNITNGEHSRDDAEDVRSRIRTALERNKRESGMS